MNIQKVPTLPNSTVSQTSSVYRNNQQLCYSMIWKTDHTNFRRSLLRTCSHDPGTTHWPLGINFASVHGLTPVTGERSDTRNCSHEFFVAPGKLRQAGYPLYNTLNLPRGNKSSCEREVTLAPRQSLPRGSSLSWVHVNRPLLKRGSLCADHCNENKGFYYFSQSESFACVKECEKGLGKQ